MDIKEASKRYIAKAKYGNISELKKISIDLDLQEIKDITQEGEEYSFMGIEIDDKIYKVPDSVLKQLKTIIEVKEDLKFFRVIRKGTTINDTTYTVIPL